MVVSWFSAGVSSAVATKIANPDKIIYIHIDDQHSDTMRFVEDCMRWFDKPVEVLRSSYLSVESACLAQGFIKGYMGGTCCTNMLKKRPRKLWETYNPGRHTYVWGFDSNEKDRADRLVKAMPKYDHRFPIIDRTKAEVHGILESAGIRRPVMYDMSYQNNNCIGCLRGGMAYWNRVRKDFPAVFAARAALERRIGHHILKECYLDELDPLRGRDKPPIVPDCGIFCEIEESPVLGEESPAESSGAEPVQTHNRPSMPQG